ncbi:MAG: hypothetical protein N4A33_11930 [Bacteriovoracaceae bacterium]|jgi:hypothetical protein|nr:hypothetical protein [Bacteriovoracaceae bacterium]
MEKNIILFQCKNSALDGFCNFLESKSEFELYEIDTVDEFNQLIGILEQTVIISTELDITKKLIESTASFNRKDIHYLLAYDKTIPSYILNSLNNKGLRSIVKTDIDSHELLKNVNDLFSYIPPQENDQNNTKQSKQTIKAYSSSIEKTSFNNKSSNKKKFKPFENPSKNKTKQKLTLKPFNRNKWKPSKTKKLNFLAPDNDGYNRKKIPQLKQFNQQDEKKGKNKNKLNDPKEQTSKRSNTLKQFETDNQQKKSPDKFNEPQEQNKKKSSSFKPFEEQKHPNNLNKFHEPEKNTSRGPGKFKKFEEQQEKKKAQAPHLSQKESLVKTNRLKQFKGQDQQDNANKFNETEKESANKTTNLNEEDLSKQKDKSKINETEQSTSQKDPHLKKNKDQTKKAPNNSQEPTDQYNEKIKFYIETYEPDEYTKNILKKSPKSIEKLVEPHKKFYAGQTFGIEFCIFAQDFFHLPNDSFISRLKFINLSLAKFFNSMTSFIKIVDHENHDIFANFHQENKFDYGHNDIYEYIEQNKELLNTLKIPYWIDETFTISPNCLLYPYFNDGNFYGYSITHLLEKNMNHQKAMQVELFLSLTRSVFF